MSKYIKNVPLFLQGAALHKGDPSALLGMTSGGSPINSKLLHIVSYII